MSARLLVVSTSHPATSAPVRVGYGPIRRVMGSPYLSAAGVRCLAVLSHWSIRATLRCASCPRRTPWGFPRSAAARCVGRVGLSTPGAGHCLSMLTHFCVPSLQEGRISHAHPLHHDDAATKASRAFNSVPTSPGMDFGGGSLRSLCVDCLLVSETPP
jgi:hypothetical protein